MSPVSVPAHPLLGVWQNIPDAFTAEVLATAGFDYLCLDHQHGLGDRASLRHALMAVRGSTTLPLVRVLSNDAGLIGQALDYGAAGVIVPMVDTAEQARVAAAACRYAPVGVRSMGPLRHALYTATDPEATNRAVRCYVMIETATGLANAEEIAATPGVDGIYIGPFDLGVSLGVPLAELGTSPRHRAAVLTIRDAARRHGRTAGIHCASPEAVRRALEDGFDMVTVATDTDLLRTGAAAALAAARAVLPPA